MNIVHSSSLYRTQKQSYGIKPDDYIQEGGRTPCDGFVLCRDEDGSPTAIYSDNIWDFNPYRLSASRISIIDFFGGVPETDINDYKGLVSELKYILFCLVYFASNGHKGRLTPNTLYHYYLILRKAAQFCLRQREHPLIGLLSLKNLLSNATYLKAFCSENSHSVTFNKKMPAILAHLGFIGEDTIGFSVIPPSELEFNNKESKQYPIIPTNIYLKLMDGLETDIEQLYGYREKLGFFLMEFSNPIYGRSYTTSKRRTRFASKGQLDMKDAIVSYGLNELFVGRFEIKERRNLCNVISKILLLIKNTIHLYTGMRNEEVLRLPYDCIDTRSVTNEVNDEQGLAKDKAGIINLVSTTTKFTGYKKEASWFAPDLVLKAIKIAQCISGAINDMWQCEPDKRLLFVSPAKLTVNPRHMSVVEFKKSRVSGALDIPLITKNDFDELLASDPNRNFQEEPAFQIGQPWPLTSHQFRRSLAFYGSNSGFLSLPTIKRQFKHLSLEMSRYYSNNFENLKTIFGFYDDEKQEYVLPDGHMAFEYQMGMPINMADQIIADVLGDDSQLFGKTGGYIERQKKKLDEGEISVLEIRKDTEKRIAKGELSYRSTLLGGCTKVGACDTAMLGEFTECLACEGSIIKLDLVEKQIEATKAELAMYDEGSCEFEVVCQDLNKLKQYQAKVISREVLE